MTLIKKILCLLLAMIMLLSLCACGGNNKKAKTPEEEIRQKVETMAAIKYIGSTIGGKELKSSRASVSTVRKISDTEYLVSGKITMMDVYGTNWNNTFDCTVEKDGTDWDVGSFDYTSENWTNN